MEQNLKNIRDKGKIPTVLAMRFEFFIIIIKYVNKRAIYKYKDKIIISDFENI